MSNQEIIICQICNTESGIRGFGMHLKHKHQLSYKEYYDAYLKKEGEGICMTCGCETKFFRGNYKSFCSNKCIGNNSEVNERRGKNISKTLRDNPEIVENRKEICRQTLADNPEIIKNRIEVRKRTMKDNPEIEEERKEKFKQTLADNPEIMINAARKNSKTLADNPEIVKNRIKVYKKTLKDNPEINTKRAEKTRQTLVDNPEIEQRRKNNLSIAHRNYYKSISNPDSKEIHCLYIMENLTKPIIKIGFCSEKTIEKRSTDICRDFGESKLILILKASHKSVNELETYLHDYFNEHCMVQPKGYGRTEWFDVQIKEEAKLIASSKLEQFS